VSNREVTVTSGATSQNKTVRLGGIGAADVVRCLAALGILARVTAEGDPGSRC